MKPSRPSFPLPAGFKQRGSIHSAGLERSPMKRSAPIGFKRTESHNMDEESKNKPKKFHLGILIQDFQSVYDELKQKLRGKKLQQAFEICQSYYMIRNEFNLTNELRILRLTYVGIRKILKRDAFLKPQKKKSTKWGPLFSVSLEVFSNWTKFLTVYVNEIKQWSGAKNALEEKESKYPELDSARQVKEGEKEITLPDYVDLMLNFKKFVKRKLKLSFEVEEYVYNLLNMMICRGELYQREKKYKLAYWYFKEAYKFSKSLQWSFVK